MATDDTFIPFPKIPRYKRELVVTEKIDGTNAQIVIGDDGSIRAGSRSRWITPGKTTDNYGFAAWVQDNRKDLLKLGPGQHFGEWYGKGIGPRGNAYAECMVTPRQFALFNTRRWGNHNPNTPDCCHVVPEIAGGDTDKAMEMLRRFGSYLCPFMMNPEGIVVFHTASRQLYKVLLENDHEPKGAH